MRANEDMMPKLSICHGHGSKMNFSVSDYIRGDTAHSPPIWAQILKIGYIAVLAILMDLIVKYSINHYNINF